MSLFHSVLDSAAAVPWCLLTRVSCFWLSCPVKVLKEHTRKVTRTKQMRPPLSLCTAATALSSQGG